MKGIPPSKLKEMNSQDTSDKEASSDHPDSSAKSGDQSPNASAVTHVPKVKRKYTVVSNQ